MIERLSRQQTDLFTASVVPATPARRGSTLDLEEALANARRSLSEAPGGAPGRDHENGDFRGDIAHLPKAPGGPEIYALCPGCKVHPDGGIFPAAELARAEGCPTGAHLPAGNDALIGGEECRRAEREGSAHPGPELRESRSRFSPSNFLKGFSLTESSGLWSGSLKPLGTMTGLLSRPRRLLENGSRQLRRSWYFYRRQAVCRRRLSRIASGRSLTI